MYICICYSFIFFLSLYTAVALLETCFDFIIFCLWNRRNVNLFAEKDITNSLQEVISLKVIIMAYCPPCTRTGQIRHTVILQTILFSSFFIIFISYKYRKWLPYKKGSNVFWAVLGNWKCQGRGLYIIHFRASRRNEMINNRSTYLFYGYFNASERNERFYNRSIFMDFLMQLGEMKDFIKAAYLWTFWCNWTKWMNL